MTPSPPCASWVRGAARELRLSGRALLALLLPGRCAACGEPASEGLCAACERECLPPAGPCCLHCGEAWPGRAQPCPRCVRSSLPFAFERAVAHWSYAGPVRRLVHAFKYGGRRDLLQPLGRRLARAARSAALLARRPLVVPVPLRRASLRARGYDQAHALAEGLALEARLPFDGRALARRRQPAAAQVASAGSDRRRQLRASFRARPARILDRSVLLVDDVLSTGATADAASRALLLAGARRVDVLVLAS